MHQLNLIRLSAGIICQTEVWVIIMQGEFSNRTTWLHRELGGHPNQLEVYCRLLNTVLFKWHGATVSNKKFGQNFACRCLNFKHCKALLNMLYDHPIKSKVKKIKTCLISILYYTLYSHKFFTKSMKNIRLFCSYCKINRWKLSDKVLILYVSLNIHN